MPGTMKLWCEAGKHHWERTAQRGRPPRNCPEHQPEKKPTTRVAVRPDENPADRMARLREIKAQRAQERVALAHEQEQERKRELAAKLPALNEEYQAAFDMACLVNTPEAWHRADILQHRIISSRKALTSNTPVAIIPQPVPETREDYSLVSYAIESMEE